jgi:FlaA1/EpsC-like NDP-sugar epimerase
MTAVSEVKAGEMHRVVRSGDEGNDQHDGFIAALLAWVYSRRRVFPLVNDLLAWPLGLSVGAGMELLFDVGVAGLELVAASLVAVIIHTFVGVSSGLYRRRWRISSFQEVSMLGTAWLATSLVLSIGALWARFNQGNLPASAVVTGSLFALGGLASMRIGWRHYWESNLRPDPDSSKRTIVYGAGEGGAQIIRSMLLDPRSGYYPVALLDDDPAKRHRELDGVKVRGTGADLARVAGETIAEVLLVAITGAESHLIKSMSEQVAKLGLELRVLPPANELVGRMTLADVRPPTVDDLLGRASVEIDLEAVSGYIRGKRVLVTGAGGSIGSELSKQIHGFEPSQLYLLDRDENALHGVQLTLEGRALLDSEMLIVANIRDRDRMFEIFGRCRPEVVFHAAALKHLTLLENHPSEGVKTNTLGTRNLLDAAMAFGVERFVNVSTDKAADPTSVLGATKLAAERLTAQAAADTGLPYVSVRFGNVLGSRGSVLPTFLAQIEAGGPVTVTDPDVTRFFMTIPEAVRLVVQAGAIGKPGEVMILDMGEPVKIVDLASQLITMLRPGVPIVFTGLRPGEKMHEILLSEAEIGVSREHPRVTHTISQVCDPSHELSRIVGMDEKLLRQELTVSHQFRLVANEPTPAGA